MAVATVQEAGLRPMLTELLEGLVDDRGGLLAARSLAGTQPCQKQPTAFVEDEHDTDELVDNDVKQSMARSKDKLKSRQSR